MSDEIIEIHDDAGVPIGRATRREAHARGLWHRTAHVWVILPAFAGGALLFQRRSMAKDVAPGLVDVAVGGHLAPGEDARATAIRELAEELGVSAAIGDLRALGVRQTANVLGFAIDHEIQAIYGLALDRPLADWRVQAEEVAALVPIPVSDGLALFAGHRDALDLDVGRAIPGGRLSPARERIARADFVPSVDGYFYRALVMARRWLRGEDHLIV